MGVRIKKDTQILKVWYLFLLRVVKFYRVTFKLVSATDSPCK